MDHPGRTGLLYSCTDRDRMICTYLFSIRESSDTVGQRCRKRAARLELHSSAVPHTQPSRRSGLVEQVPQAHQDSACPQLVVAILGDVPYPG